MTKGGPYRDHPGALGSPSPGGVSPLCARAIISRQCPLGPCIAAYLSDATKNLPSAHATCPGRERSCPSSGMVSFQIGKAQRTGVICLYLGPFPNLISFPTAPYCSGNGNALHGSNLISPWPHVPFDAEKTIIKSERVPLEF